MKIQFKSITDKLDFAGIDDGYNDHNRNFTKCFGMNVIEVTQNDGWWDIMDSDGGLEWTVNIKKEGRYFNILEA